MDSIYDFAFEARILLRDESQPLLGLQLSTLKYHV